MIKREELKHIIANLFKHVLVAIISILLVNLYFFSVKQYKFVVSYKFSIELILTFLLFILMELCLSFYRSAKMGKLAQEAGLFYFSHRKDEKSKKQSDSFLKKEALNSCLIYIACSSGYETFGNKNSPLHEALKKCD